MLKFVKILLGTLIFCLLTGAGLIYFFRDKIKDAFQARAKMELADQGIFADWRLEPVAFGPDMVLKLREIKTFRDSHLQEIGAELSNLDIHVHLLPSLASKKPQATFLMKNATLTLFDLTPKSSEAGETDGETGPGTEPEVGKVDAAAAPAVQTAEAKVEAKEPEVISVTECNGNAELTATQWRLSPSSLVFQGIRYSVSGISDLPRSAGGPRKPLIRTVEVKDPAAPAEPSSLDFSPLVPLAELLDYRKAGFKPEIKISYKAALDRDAAWNIDAQADTVAFPSREKNLSITTQSLVRHDASGEIRSLVIKDGDFAAEGNATIDKGAAGLNVTSIASNLDWIGILRDFPIVNGALDAYRITSNPNIELAGVWSFVRPRESAMTGSIRSLHAEYLHPTTGGAKSAAGKVPLVLKDAEAMVQIGGGTFEFKNGFATLAEGPVRFEFRFQPFETGAFPWNLGLVGENLALVQLTSAFAETGVEGTANLRFEGSGDLKPVALNGQGGLQITAMQPIKIPLVSPLLDLLSTVIPNLFKSGSEQLEASFTIKDGVLGTEDLTVGLPVVQIRASGSVNLPTEETKFEASANLRGVLQRFAPGLPGALAIEGGGPLKKVKWHFKNLPATKPAAQPGPAPGAGQMVPTPSPVPTPATGLPAKADELIRTVDQIGGLIKGLNGEAKAPVQSPAPVPVPAPGAPDAPASKP